MHQKLRNLFQPRFFTKAHFGQEIHPAMVASLDAIDYAQMFKAAVLLRSGVSYSVWFPNAATRNRWMRRLRKAMENLGPVMA